MRRLALATLFVSQFLIAQPWPLIRIRQVPGADLSALTSPVSAPDAGIQVFGFTSITGKLETWQMETHLSFAGIEQFDANHSPRAYDNHSQTLVLVHRHFWSHRPEEALQALRKARYVQISTFQVALGSESEFAGLLTARKARLDSINLDRPDLAYQVIYGAPTGTVILISPIVSLKTLDEGVSRSSSAYLRSTGSPSARGAAPGTAAGDILQDNALFRILPGLSAVSDSTADEDPAFWRRK